MAPLAPPLSTSLQVSTYNVDILTYNRISLTYLKQIIYFFSIFTVGLPMTTVEEPLLDDSTDHAKIYSSEVSSKNHIKSQSNERLL